MKPPRRLSRRRVLLAVPAVAIAAKVALPAAFYRIADGSLEHKTFIDGNGQLVTDNWGGSLSPS